MDPTAPKDPNSPNTEPPSSSPNLNPQNSPNPIQPGQFVVAQEGQTPPQPEPPPPAQVGKGLDVSGIGAPDTSKTQQPNSPTGRFGEQPNPAPFAPPSPQDIQSPQNPSKIHQFRKIVVVLAIVILILIIIAVAWFFVFGKQSAGPASTKIETETQIEEPPPIPQKPGNGFADLPEATSSPPEASPSAQ